MTIRMLVAFVVIGILCAGCRAAAPLPLTRQEAPKKLIIADSPSHLLRATHVLVVRFGSINASPWAADPAGGVSRSLDVEVMLEEVAKGALKEVPGALVKTTLKQFGTGSSRIAGVLGAWSRQRVERGGQFVAIAVTSSENAAEILRDPACQRALAAGEALADVHLAEEVEAKALDVFGAVSLAKTAAPSVNFLFADYLWERYSLVALADGKKFDPIAELLEQPGLSQTARGTLISRLTTGLTSPEPLPEKQLTRFAIVLFHLLTIEEARPFHDTIVGTYLPAVLDIAAADARSANKVFEDHPGEKARAIQILNAYKGSESPAAVLAWLSR